MATLNATIKRWDGSSTWDIINPSTTMSQVDGLNSALLLKEDKTNKNAVNGYAGLDSSAKIALAQLPDAAIHGMEYIGVISLDSLTAGGTPNSFTSLETIGGVPLTSATQGDYFIFAHADDTQVITITPDADDYIYDREGAAFTSGGTIEVSAGDWLICNHVSGSIQYWVILDNNATNLYAAKAHLHTGVYLPIDGTADVALVANKLTTARNIQLTGDVTGNVNFDGSSDVSITTAVGNDTHQHNSGTSLYNTSASLHYGGGVGSILSTTIEGIDSELYSRAKVTYASAAPPSPRTNDIWIDV